MFSLLCIFLIKIHVEIVLNVNLFRGQFLFDNFLAYEFWLIRSPEVTANILDSCFLLFSQL